MNIIPIREYCILLNTRRYGPLRGPTSSSCGWLWPLAEAFFALREKKELIMLFWPIFGIFWCPVVTLVTLKGIPKTKKIQKKKKIYLKISKNQKNPNSPKITKK